MVQPEENNAESKEEEKIPKRRYRRDWLTDWNTPIKWWLVQFTKRLLRDYAELIPVENMIHGEATDTGFIVNEIYVTGFSTKDIRTLKGDWEDRGAIFFKRDCLVRIGFAWYPFRFSIPKSQLLEYETEKEGIEQTIIITEWGYENCYMLPYNKIYENWGKRMSELFEMSNSKHWEVTPYYTNNLHKTIVESIKKIDIQHTIQTYKKAQIRNAIRKYKADKAIAKLYVEV